MRICGQWFNETLLARISEAVQKTPELSRSAPAERVCDWLGWTDTRGQPHLGGARKALAELHRRGAIVLPAAACRPMRSGEPDVVRSDATAPVVGDLASLGTVRVECVETAQQRAVYRQLMQQHPHLASHALGLLVRQLPEDWELRYGVRPLLLETVVHADHDGTCYKAAGWEHVGKTAGRRDGIPKAIWLRPLAPTARQALRQGQSRMPCERPEQPTDWIDNEFGGLRVWDKRLKERLHQVAEDFWGYLQSPSLTRRCGDRARTMGAYRFFKNPKVSMPIILEAHRQAVVERMAEHPLVLVPQDTTSINYTGHRDAGDMGPIGSRTTGGPIGLMMHNGHVFIPEGVPLGVVSAEAWARDPDSPRILVRAHKGRNRRVIKDSARTLLTAHVAGLAVAGRLELQLPRRGSRRARQAALDVRFAPVQISPPKGSKEAPIDLWAVHLVEPNPPTGIEPVEWLLLTNVPTTTDDDALERARWTSARWGIEVFHRTLKTGCRIEDRQLGYRARLESCLAVDLVMAWRIYYLTMMGRVDDDLPCTVFFHDPE